MPDYFRPERFMCWDCGHDTREMGEMYMVYHDVWEKATRYSGGTHMLCIGCIESRLGYTLNKTDFMRNCPQNQDWIMHRLGRRYTQSLRLRQRLRSHDRMMISGHVRRIPDNRQATSMIDAG